MSKQKNLRRPKIKMNSKDFELLERWEASDKTPEVLDRLAKERGIRPHTVACMLREYGLTDCPLVVWMNDRYVLLWGEEAENYQPQDVKGRLALVTNEDKQVLTRMKLAGRSRDEIYQAMRERSSIFTPNMVNVVWRNLMLLDPDLRYQAELARRRKLYNLSIRRR